MIELKRAPEMLRSNRAVAARPWPGAAVARGAGSVEAAQPLFERWPPSRPNLLARVARAARSAVREMRESGDVPLPHLYRGRDFEHRPGAA